MVTPSLSAPISTIASMIPQISGLVKNPLPKASPVPEVLSEPAAAETFDSSMIFGQ